MASLLLFSMASCKEYCTCTSFAPYQPEVEKEEYLLEKGQSCSDFEVTPDGTEGIRCE
jgi:hypothetical protein